MKKFMLFLSLIVCCAMAAVAQEADIVIKGKIDGIKKGRLYMLARSSEESTDTLGSCDFKKGKFELKAVADEPLLVQLVVEGFSGGFTLFAEPGTSYKAYLCDGPDFYINGGKLNSAYTVHMRKSDSLRAVIEELQTTYDAYRSSRKFRSASLVNDTLKREKDYLREFTTGFLADNDNVISAYTIYSNIVMRDAALKETKSMYASLGEGAKNS